ISALSLQFCILCFQFICRTWVR
ncbi:hypothetical protein TNCT_559381, partial [Trichonephila clavata]